MYVYIYLSIYQDMTHAQPPAFFSSSTATGADTLPFRTAGLSLTALAPLPAAPLSSRVALASLFALGSGLDFSSMPALHLATASDSHGCASTWIQ